MEPITGYLGHQVSRTGALAITGVKFVCLSFSIRIEAAPTFVTSSCACKEGGYE